MEQSTIALIVLGVTLILFISERLPLVVTSILGMLAMTFTGCCSYSEALSGFSNVAVIVILGIDIITESFFVTGITDVMGNWFLKHENLTEKRFLILATTIATLISSFLNGLIVITLFIPIINALSVKTEGKITKKNCYLPVAIGALLGGNLSVVGSSSMITASTMMGESWVGHEMSFFGPSLVGLPGALVTIGLVALTGTKFQEKWFDFPELENKHVEVLEHKDVTAPAWKRWVAIGVLAGLILAFILGGNFAAFALLGVCVLIITGCLTVEQAMKSVNVSTFLLVGSILGFAKGIDVSGAGQVIANKVVSWCGPLGESPWFMCVVMLFLATLLSNVMFNNGTVVILVPIALSFAQMFGANPLAYVAAVGVGANLSVMTPICTTTIAVTASAGYRFKDYVRYGGLFNILSFVLTALVLGVYFI